MIPVKANGVRVGGNGQSHLYQGRMSGRAFFLPERIHPVMSCRAGWIFHPATSLGSFGSSKIAALCMQARKTHAHSFYLGIDDFGNWLKKKTNTLNQP